MGIKTSDTTAGTIQYRISWERLEIEMSYGGEGGIRTHGALAGTPHFECGAFDHSATSPLEHDDALVSAGCLIAMKIEAGKGRKASLCTRSS
jgi:hypothetical protein